MAEQKLDAAQIGACIEQMGSEGVSQNVGAERFRDAQLLAQLRAGDAHPACHHGLVWPSSGKEPVLGLPPAPVKAQQLQQLGDNMTWRGNLPLPSRMLMIIRLLSISLTFRSKAS